MNASISYRIFKSPELPLLAAVYSNRVDIDYNGAREQWTRSRFAFYLNMARTSKAYQVESCNDPYMAENFDLSLHKEA